jgi:hypothetical protein
MSEAFGLSRTTIDNLMLYNGSMFNRRWDLRTIRLLIITSAVSVSTLLMVGARTTAAHAAGVDTPTCAGSNLVGAFVRNQVGMGHVVTTIAITNVGTTTCTLGGYPGLVGTRGNEKIKLRVTAHGTYGGNLRPVTLAPRMSGALIIGTGDLCAPYYGAPPAGHSYSGLIVVLPKNKGVVPVLGVALDTTCGLVESQLGWRARFSIQGI